MSFFAEPVRRPCDRVARSASERDTPARESDYEMRFMMFMYPDISEDEWVPEGEAVEAMGRYNEELRKAGMLLALDGLQPPSEGASVEFSGGGATVTDGPFAEAKEVVGGYWMIQARDKAEAVEWAKRCPRRELPDRGPPRLRDGGLPRGGPGGGAGSGRLSRCPRRAAPPPIPGPPSRRSGGSSRPGSSPGSRGWCATSAWPRTWRRTRWSPRSSAGRESGVPDNPGAWLMATAKNRAIDLARRRTTLRAQARGARPRSRA